MPGGFGIGSFGSGFFGEDFWEEHVLWEDMPERRRARDLAAESFMRDFVDVLTPSIRMLRHSARDFFNLRDPWECRTRYNDRHEIEFVGIEEHESDDPDDRWLSLYIKGDPIEAASKSWIIESQDVAFKRWTVERVYKLDSYPGGTNFDNWRVVIKGTEDPPVVGTSYWFHPEEQLPSLMSDFGEDLDQYFTEDKQRSQVLHHDQRRMWKGTQIGYENVCKLYGFTVTLTHLWRLRCGFHLHPAITPVYEIPVGSGIYYTSMVPRRPKFDHIAGDVIPADLFCHEPAFTSVIPIGPYPISSATAFSTPYDGYELIINAPAGALDAITWPGFWHITVPDGSGGFLDFYLEAIPEYLGASMWRVVVSGSGGVLSGTTSFYYACPVWLDCCYCGTHKISVDLAYTLPSCTPTVTTGCLTDRERIYIFERTLDALYDVKPIHVEFARLSLTVPMEASLELRALLRKGVSKRLVAGVKYRYDIIEGDAIAADQYSLTATVTK